MEKSGSVRSKESLVSPKKPLTDELNEDPGKPSDDAIGYIDFDDLLPLIGEFGVYQKLLFVYMIPFMFFAAFVYLDQIFIILVPNNYWCDVHPLLQQLPSEEAKELTVPRLPDGSYSKCEMYDVNYTQVLLKRMLPNDSLETMPCKYGWLHDLSEVPYKSIAIEYGWVCKNEMLPTYSYIVFFTGSILGGILYGSFADHCGRVPALISANIMGCIGGIITALSNGFVIFAIGRFLVGMAFDSCYTLMYILVLEYVGPSYRTFVANASVGLFYTPASCLVPWLAYYIANWRQFSTVTSATLSLSIFIQCLVYESARWHVSVGHIDEAIDILLRVAKRNGREVPPEIIDRFRICCLQFYSEERQYRTYTVFSLFKRWRLCRMTIYLTLIWMSISLVYDGHVRTINTIGTDVFLTFTIASATELPSDIFLILTLDRCGRRVCAFFQMIACGSFSILAGLLQGKYEVAGAAIIGRFFANICYNIGLQYAAELLPTVVRAQGIAFIHIMGYVANIVSPWILYLAYSNTSLALFILGTLGVFGGVLSLCLPETLHRDLPQTIEDGVVFGKDQSFWSSPCCGKQPSDKKIKRTWHSGTSLREQHPASIRSRQLSRHALRTPPIPSSTNAKAHNSPMQRTMQQQLQGIQERRDKQRKEETQKERDKENEEKLASNEAQPESGP